MQNCLLRQHSSCVDSLQRQYICIHSTLETCKYDAYSGVAIDEISFFLSSQSSCKMCFSLNASLSWCTICLQIKADSTNIYEHLGHPSPVTTCIYVYRQRSSLHWMGDLTNSGFDIVYGSYELCDEWPSQSYARIPMMCVISIAAFKVNDLNECRV